MKNLNLLLVVSLILFQCTPKESKDGEWISLFNGKDFSGWKATEHTDCFKIEDGMILANGERSHLFYVGEDGKADFTNFELSLDVKTYYLANSGVYFHTAYQEEGWPEKGYEAQINNTHKGGGDYKEVKKTGSLYGVKNVFKAFAKDSVWFNLNIRVEGKHIVIKVDDKVVVDYTEPSNPSRFRAVDKGQDFLSHGTFALQGHDLLSTMYFKNIKVKILDAPVDQQLEATDIYPDVLEKESHHYAIIDEGVLVDSAFNIDSAMNDFYKTAINLGLVADASVLDVVARAEFIKKYSQYPVFLGITNKAPGEPTAPFDYAIGEITSFKNKKGEIVNVQTNEVKDKESFMEAYVAAIEKELDQKNMDIWSSPTLLPPSLATEYNSLWTEKRIQRVIEAAKRNGVAIEINTALKLPGMDFIKRAKEKGCRFSSGGIYTGGQMTNPAYFIQAIDECKLDYKDIFIPGNN